MSLRPGRGQGYPPPPPSAPRSSSGQTPAYGSSSPPSAGPAPASGGHAYGGYSQPSQPSYYGGYAYNSPGGSYGANNNTGYGTSSTGHTGYGYAGSSSSPYGGYSAATPAPVPQSPAKNLNKRRGSKGHPNTSNGGSFAVFRQAWVWATLLSILLAGLCLRYRAQVSRLCEELEVDSLDSALTRITAIVSSERRVSGSMQSIKDSLRIANEHKIALERDNRKLQAELKEMRDHYESPEAHEELDRIMAREQGWMNHVEVLQRRTQRESARSVKEKFGHGPYQVEFGVLLPNQVEENYFVVELAPLAAMPHATHIFLEQVAHGLWDKAWFYINGPHIMQIGPQPDEMTEEMPLDELRELALRPFKEKALESLAFPEYSGQYPHSPWTLGFTGRPGGPDFYINKVDNSEAHGPGGQYQHDLDEFADPCFGKVIKGFDTLENIARTQTILTGEYQFFFEFPVQIVRATILEKPIPFDMQSFQGRKDGFGNIELVGDKDGANVAKKPKRIHKPVFDHQVEP